MEAVSPRLTQYLNSLSISDLKKLILLLLREVPYSSVEFLPTPLNSIVMQAGRYRVSGAEYSGQTLGGTAAGEGVTTFQDGRRHKGLYSGGTLEGEGELTFPNGDQYSGNFYRGFKHGLGRYEYGSKTRGANQGDIYYGGFWNDVRYGVGAYYYSTGAVKFSLYEDDAPTGPFVWVSEDLGTVKYGKRRLGMAIGKRYVYKLAGTEEFDDEGVESE